MMSLDDSSTIEEALEEGYLNQPWDYRPFPNKNPEVDDNKQILVIDSKLAVAIMCGSLVELVVDFANTRGMRILVLTSHDDFEKIQKLAYLRKKPGCLVLLPTKEEEGWRVIQTLAYRTVDDGGIFNLLHATSDQDQVVKIMCEHVDSQNSSGDFVEDMESHLAYLPIETGSKYRASAFEVAMEAFFKAENEYDLEVKHSALGGDTDRVVFW